MSEKAANFIMSEFKRRSIREDEVLPQNAYVQAIMKNIELQQEDGASGLDKILTQGLVELTKRQGLRLTSKGCAQIYGKNVNFVHIASREILSLFQARGLRANEVLQQSAVVQLPSQNLQLRGADIVSAVEALVERGLVEITDRNGLRLTNLGFKQLN